MIRLNKSVIILSIVVILIFCAISLITYAYFASNNASTSKYTTTYIKGDGTNNYVFLGTTNESLISVNNVEITDSNSEIKNKEITLTSSLLSNSNTKYKCSYDIYYKWADDTDDYTITGSNEFTYSLDGGTETNFVASSNKTPQKINENPIVLYNKSEDIPTEKYHSIILKFNKADSDQTINENKLLNIKYYIDNIECVEPDAPINFVTYLNNLISDNTVVEAGNNGYLKKQDVTVTQNSNLGINSSSYTNIVYTGSNPNNYIDFNGEKWRIIGIFNEDSHGIANTQLIKIIRNNSLIVSNEDSTGKTAKWDNKISTVMGSYNANYSSLPPNEWSDSQLMFMLNGENAINKGKMYNGTTYTYSTTRVDGDYIQASRNGTGTYYTIWNKSKGSYLSYDANGNAITNKQIYTSSSASTSSYSGKTAILEKTLSRDSQDLIQEVIWHLGGWKSAYITAANFYSYERSANVSNGYTSYSAASTQRSVIWSGKVGLMYPSDFGYANSSSTCISRGIGSNYNSNNINCASTDWLRYTESTSSKNGNATFQWTITPSLEASHFVFFQGGYISRNPTNGSTPYAVRPAVYLIPNVSIETDGDGSYSNPYVIAY